MKNGRNDTIEVPDGKRYVCQWTDWYDKINPRWRVRENGKLVKGGQGDWSPMAISGSTGFVVVIAALVALRQVIGVPAWTEALQDLAWVIREVRTSKDAEK